MLVKPTHLLGRIRTDKATAPHIGHLYTLILTDILKRWQVLLGKQALLCTGTDEHGMKVGLEQKISQDNAKSYCL